MEELPIFTAALELESPWFIKEIAFKGSGKDKQLHIYVSHKRGVKFEYESELCSVHDHQERTWRHLNFFQHECHLHAPVPRVKTGEGKVRLIEVPWAKPGSSFTLLFELDVLKLLRDGMSNSSVGKRLKIYPKRVFRIVSRHVGYALATQDLSDVKEMSADETSSKKGHNYFTILADRVAKKVVGIAIGKDKNAFAHALLDMEVRGADRHEVRTITMDMSRSYISAAAEYIDKAEVVFDRFHIMKNLNKAVDAIRREEQAKYDELKKTRYLWLRNNSNLTEMQRDRISYLKTAYPGIGTAYRLKELFKSILDDAYHDQRLKPINQWMKEAWSSGLKPIQKFVNMLKDHWYGIKSYFKRLVTNGYAERINLKIQEIKRIAKGFGNSNNYMLMIYFHLGGLDLGIH